MRVAVISDVHSNLHALEAVLAELDAEGVDAIWCLGDVVGYGARPNECCALVRDRADVCLAGNHDLVIVGDLDLAFFAGEAAAAARWTTAVLEEDSRRFLSALRPAGRAEGAELYHGSPRDPVWEYILGPDAAYAAFQVTEAPLVLVGHSHVALAIELADGQLAGGVAPAGQEVELASARRLLLNPGSVGQPRDGDPRAAYLLLDTDRGRAVFKRVDYPIARTQEEIRAAGLPPLLAARLEHGT